MSPTKSKITRLKF